MTDSDLNKIITLANNLNRYQLLTLNRDIVSLIKKLENEAIYRLTDSFVKNDIVSFKDSTGKIIQGVVTKKYRKTLQINTPDNYYLNIPSTYLFIPKNPDKKIKKFRQKIINIIQCNRKIYGMDIA